MATPNKTKHLPESILIEILARLPLRSIARFKSVRKTWKSTLESVYFRRLFVSLHKNSCSSWSLMFKGQELLNFHGCKNWDLPKSLASYSLPLNTDYIKLSFSNGLVLVEGIDKAFLFVGNPVLKQWFQIPPSPYQSPYESASSRIRSAASRLSSRRFGFVTRVDENGVVLDFKVVSNSGRWILELKEGASRSAYLDLLIYSSETGRWTTKKICSLHYQINLSARPVINLNGTFYLSSGFSPDHEGVLIAHDFFSDSDQCRVIRLPDYDLNYKWDSKRALTTSLGSVIYIKLLVDQKGDNLLKIWRLNNDDDCWQLFSEVVVSFDICAPLAMHPFDCDIVYLWSQEKRLLVSFNLRTQNYKVLGDVSTRHNVNDHDPQDCFVNQPACEKYMNENSQRSSIAGYRAPIQYMLPLWMESMPCPPQVEMMDTTSLLSCIS